MPLFLAVTAKSALVVGATIGLAAAVLSNDRVIEFAAETLQKGADHLNEHLKNKRAKVAHCIAMGFHTDPVLASEATTPSVSDDEYQESEKETESEFDDTYDLKSNSTGFKKFADDTLSVRSLD
ncbi:hypothetical protein JCM33374_g4558 [Metschnikowia sp. JCM 33374]|nr:hypothetical protein JCM33374_g4558 [Metschnikowia sp. JCM 33374]